MAKSSPIQAGVIGWPIAQSKSPRIHGHWLKEHAIDGRYDAIAVAPDSLPDFIRRARSDNWRGFNVTLPHKQHIIPLLDDIEPAALAIGAVNTVVQIDTRLIGRNTDAYGFMANLTAHCPDHYFKHALVIGAGGAARAVVYALKQQGMQVTIANRTRDKAEALAHAFGAHVMAIDEINLSDFDLLVNTTSLGMTGQPPLSLSLDSLLPKCVVYDIVYAPLYTELLLSAQQRGNETVTGVGMLLHQAVPGFEAWFGLRPVVTSALERLIIA